MVTPDQKDKLVKHIEEIEATDSDFLGKNSQ
jgi:hypothetical protein